MEGERKFGNVPEPDPIPEGMMDSELVMFFIGHIDNPCEAEVAPGVKKNIRDFYLREAERLLPILTNPFAKELLEKKIEQYRQNPDA